MDASHCVQVIGKVRGYKIDSKKLTLLTAQVCERLGVHHYHLCVQFVGTKTMKSLNKKFRAKDKSTDVLSFPQYEWKTPLKFHDGPITTVKRKVMNPMPLGDVVISLSDAAVNAKESKHGLDQEVCFLVVHGLLHLVGHDHMKAGEKKRMFGEQDKIMSMFAKAKDKKPDWSKCVTKARKPKVK